MAITFDVSATNGLRVTASTAGTESTANSTSVTSTTSSTSSSTVATCRPSTFRTNFPPLGPWSTGTTVESHFTNRELAGSNPPSSERNICQAV